MAITRGVLVDGQLIPNATGALYTPATGVRAIINSVSMHANAATADVQLFNVESGGSAGNSNQVVQKTFAADEDFTAPTLIGSVIEAGGSLQGNDGGNGGTGVNIVITLTEFSGDS